MLCFCSFLVQVIESMENQHYYTQLLRSKLHILLGRTVQKNADLILLESIINNKTKVKHKVSYSTLRRFFGFISGTSPSNKTLDNLSQSIDYRDFTDFCTKNYPKNDDTLNEFLNKLSFQKELSKKDISQLSQLKNNTSYQLYFSQFLMRILHTQNSALLYSIFQEKELFPNLYRQQIILANSIGMVLRLLPYDFISKTILPLVEANPLAQNYILYLFVDYSSFNKYYGMLIQKIKLSKIIGNDNKLFIQLIRNSFLFFTQNKMLLLPQADASKLHPILSGRYHAQLLLNPNSQTNKATILNQLKDNPSKQAYTFELIPALIFLKDFETIQYIEDQYYEQILTPNQWPFENKKAFAFIAFALNAIKNKQFHSTRIMLELINLPQLSPSYRNYTELLTCIPFYHLYTELKQKKLASQYLNKYTELANQMGFSFFSPSFIETYFDA